MKPIYENLHREMLWDIKRCLKLPHPEMENAERCFWIARKYWEKLKELLKGRPFKDERDEIEFFRNVKPQFTCYIEYFVILSEALLFIPEERQCAITYWEEESNRLKRFCDRHHSFVQYYESGNRHQDNLYFLRKSGEDLKFVPAVPAYDMDIAFCSSHDQLVRSYLAYKKYYEYAIGRVEGLKVNCE